MAARGGRLRFAGVAGRAEVWLDRVLLARKDNAAPGPLLAQVPPAPGRARWW
ncbi:hypothetical protein ACFS32_19480 [Novosphingobium pokkalii]|uniref:hypothetical protein n=1 Tax=Novosphingobium pokkalii TaxID=1770194 RepID=UPI00362524B0